MQASGQTKAHELHAMHFSGDAMKAKWYPRSLTSLGCNDNTSTGQATTHRLQPLQRTVSTVTAPFIFAMIIVCFRQ